MHTQGPWEAKHLDANHFVIEAGDSGNVARTTIPIGADAAVVEANAKLIAAAPMLLANAQLVVQRAREHGLHGHDFGDLSNAIALLEAASNKALGR